MAPYEIMTNIVDDDQVTLKDVDKTCSYQVLSYTHAKFSNSVATLCLLEWEWSNCKDSFWIQGVLHFQVSHKSKKEIYLAPIRIFLRTKIDDYWTIVTAICDFRYGKHQWSYVGKMTRLLQLHFTQILFKKILMLTFYVCSCKIQRVSFFSHKDVVWVALGCYGFPSMCYGQFTLRACLHKSY
jgi:hypothetical protein